MSKKIRITIDPKTALVTVKPIGFDGPDCLEATKKLERMLGMIDDDSGREMTDENNNKESDQQKVGQ